MQCGAVEAENSKPGADWCLITTNTCLEPPFTTAGHPSQCPAQAGWQMCLAWLQGLKLGRDYTRPVL